MLITNNPKINAIAWLERHSAYGWKGDNYLGNRAQGIKGWPKIDLAPTEESKIEINRFLDWAEALGWKETMSFGPGGYPLRGATNDNKFGLHPQDGPYLSIDFKTDLGNFVIRLRKVDANEQFCISGATAFWKFKELCRDNGIDLEALAIKNGEAVKDEIEKPLIDVDPNLTDIEIEGAHHIDFHSAYPGALKETHPEFAPVIDDLYAQRKTDETMKAVLNLTIGFMQSQWCGEYIDGKKFAYAHADLARDAINRAREKLEGVTNRLRDSGRLIIAHNTDGVWYAGDVYHGEGEGPDCGQWSNDHLDCKIRFKTKGAYEYIENGKYHAVVRGRTALDLQKPRDTWGWGDIYESGSSLAYGWENGRIITKEEKTNE